MTLPVRSSESKGPSTFTFVSNTDTAKERASTMRSHVMREYHRRQKQLRAEQLNARIKPPPGFQYMDRKANMIPRESPERTCCEDVRTEDACYKCQRERLTVAAARVKKDARQNSLQEFLSAGFVDPFNCTSVAMTDTMYLYLGQFRMFTMVACYPLDPTRMSAWWWRKALDIPALLHAVLFLAAGHQSWLLGQQGNSSLAVQKLTNDCIRHRGASLRILNEILVDPDAAVTEANILTVAAHHSVEAISGNVVAVDAHMNGLERLIQLHGGADSLQHTTLAKIYMSDIKSAALKLSHPVFPMSLKWESEILQLNSIKAFESSIPSELISLGASFNKPQIAQHLSPLFFVRLARFRQLVIYHELALRQPGLIKVTDNDLFILFEHRLLSLPVEERAVGIYSTSIQECTRIAVLLYSNTRIWKFFAFVFVGSILSSLREQLLHTGLDSFLDDADTDTGAPDLLFWILFIGAAAAKGHVSRTWFLVRLSAVAERLELRRWEEVRELLTGFFFVDRVFEAPLEELWREVVLTG